MRRLLIACVLVLVATAATGDYSVTYLEGGASVNRGGGTVPVTVGMTFQDNDELIVTANGLVSLEDEDDEITMGRTRMTRGGGGSRKWTTRNGRVYITRKKTRPRWKTWIKPFWGKVYLQNGFMWSDELGLRLMGLSVGFIGPDRKEGILEQEELDFELHVTDWSKAKVIEIGADNADARVALEDQIKDIVVEGDKRVRELGDVSQELATFLDGAITYTKILDDAVEAEVAAGALKARLQTWLQKPIVGKFITRRRTRGSTRIVKKRLCFRKKKPGAVHRRRPGRLHKKSKYRHRTWWKKPRDKKWRRRFVCTRYRVRNRMSDAQIRTQIHDNYPNWHQDVLRAGGSLAAWSR